MLFCFSSAASLLDLLFMADHYDYLLKVVLIGDSKVALFSLFKTPYSMPKASFVGWQDFHFASAHR